MKSILLFAVLISPPLDRVLAASLHEANVAAYAGARGPRDMGTILVELVNGKGQSIIVPMRGYPDADIRGSSENPGGIAEFAFGSVFLGSAGTSGDWEVNQIRYYRFFYKDSGGHEWDLKRLLINVRDTAGTESVLLDLHFRESIRIDRTVHSGDFYFAFDHPHGHSNPAHTRVKFEVETAGDDLRTGSFVTPEVELTTGQILRAYPIGPLDNGESDTRAIELPAGFNSSHIHRCRLYRHGRPGNFGESSPDKWDVRNWRVTAEDPRFPAPVTVDTLGHFSRRGFEVATTATYVRKHLYDFATERFLLNLDTGGDDLRGATRPESELRVLLHLRSGEDVPLCIPCVDRLGSWTRHNLEAVTEDHRLLRLSEVLGFSVRAVRRGNGTTWPDCYTGEFGGFTPDPFRGDDEWDLVNAALWAAPREVPHPIAFPPNWYESYDSLCERVPGTYSGGLGFPDADEVVNPTYRPAPGWIRLVTGANLNDHQVVSEGIDPRPELIGSVDFDITPRLIDYLALFGWFEAFPYLLEFSTASEAVIFDEQANGQRAENELVNGSANQGVPVVLDYPSWRVWRFGFEATHWFVDDMNRDSTPDLVSYATGVENGKDIPLPSRSGPLPVPRIPALNGGKRSMPTMASTGARALQAFNSTGSRRRNEPLSRRKGSQREDSLSARPSGFWDNYPREVEA